MHFISLQFGVFTFFQIKGVYYQRCIITCLFLIVFLSYSSSVLGGPVIVTFLKPFKSETPFRGIHVSKPCRPS